MKFKISKDGMFDKMKWVRTRKKKTKVLIACGMAVVLAVGGIYGFGIRKQKKAMAGESPVMSAQAEKGNLSTTIEGTGTLANSDSENIKIPVGIKVKKVKVSVGDDVKKGDTLATVDSVSLSAELLATQEELDDINSQINEEADNDTTQYVTSSVDGRVKKIYAKKNTEVGTTILDKGSLILISMDGKMAVNLETSVSVKVGEEVTVILEDNSTVTGTVVKAGDDSCTVTVTDNGTGYKEKVTVRTSSGKTVGTGKLYINKEAKVTAASGTVKKILVSENEKISEGDSLLKLKGDFQTAAYLALETEKENMEEKLESLLKIAQNNTITAESDGIVTAVYVTDSTASGEESGSSNDTTGSSGTGMTQTSTKTSSDTEKGITQTNAVKSTQSASAASGFLLTSAESMSSSGTDNQSGNSDSSENQKKSQTASVASSQSETAEKNEASSNQTDTGTTTAGKENSTTSQNSAASESSTTSENSAASESSTTSQNSTTVENSVTTLTSVGNAGITPPETGKNPVTSISGTAYQGTVVWSPADSVFQADTSYSANVTLTAKKGYSFSSNPSIQIDGASISGIKVNGDTEKNTLAFTASFQKTSTEENTSNQENNTDQTQNGGKTAGGAGGMSGSGSSAFGGTASSGSAGMSGSSGTSSTTGGSGSSDSSSDTASENEELTTAFSLDSGEDMTLSVNVDELDILSVSLGQTAALTLDAVENQEFEGKITGIDKTGTSNGGVTKYAVEITVPKEDTMLAGMNASASIIVSEASDVLLIPAIAVTEEGNTSYVYTEKDDSTGELSGKTKVETGTTDGNNIEITSGLSEGDTVYYKMLGTGSSDSEEEDNLRGGEGGMTGGFGGAGGQGGKSGQGGQNAGGSRDGEPPQGRQGGTN